jgi:hypothetical protein
MAGMLGVHAEFLKGVRFEKGLQSFAGVQLTALMAFRLVLGTAREACRFLSRVKFLKKFGFDWHFICSL